MFKRLSFELCQTFSMRPFLNAKYVFSKGMLNPLNVLYIHCYIGLPYKYTVFRNILNKNFNRDIINAPFLQANERCI